MKRIIFYVLIVIGVGAAVKWKQGVINEKRSMPTISINNEYQKNGKPVEILPIERGVMKFSERLTGKTKGNKVTLFVGANQWKRIKVGQESSLVGDEKLVGKVVSKKSTPNTETGLFQVTVTFDESDQIKLESVVVDIITSEKEEVVSIPTAAIKEDNDKKYVWVLVGENKAEPRDIKTGEKSLYQTEVTSGLDSGDKVIVRGASSLTTSDKVRIAQTGDKK